MTLRIKIQPYDILGGMSNVSAQKERLVYVRVFQLERGALRLSQQIK